MPGSSIRAFADNAVDPPVRGFLHTPESPNGNALILSHGAGSNAQAPLLVALAETFSAAGFIVLRCDLPYRHTRSFGPPGPADAARDRAGLKNAIAAIGKILVARENPGAPLPAGVARGGDFPGKDQNEGAPFKPGFGLSGDFPSQGKIFLGGHSYGGRQSSLLCAELAEQAADLVSGLLLLSYPLHPPRRPEQQRTQHLPSLRTPALFFHGTRDAFGSIAEMERALKMIPAETKLIPVEGAGHVLGFKGKAKKEELPHRIFSEFSNFFDPSS